MSITVRITNNYGREAIYPVCDTARVFAKLTGNKTLSAWDISQIKTLGYEVQVEAQTL